MPSSSPRDRVERARPLLGTLVNISCLGLPAAEAHARLDDLLPGNGTLAGVPAVEDTLIPNDKNNFAPRVGFAFRLNDAGSLVVRGGYGIYYDQSALAPAEALYFNSPFFDNNIFFSLPGLPLTLNDPFPSFFPFPLPDSAPLTRRKSRSTSADHAV